MGVWRIWLVGLWLALGGATAHASTVLDPPDTSSPFATFTSFETSIVTLRQAFFQYRKTRSPVDLRATLAAAERFRRLFDLEPLPPAMRDEAGRESISLMMDILNRIPPFDRQAIPGANGETGDKLPARWTIPKTEIRIVRTEAGPFSGEYQFSADTIRRLPEFHARIIGEPVTRAVREQNWSRLASEITGPLISPSVVDLIPDVLKTPVFDSPLWKLLASLLLFLLFVYLGVRVSDAVRRRAEGGSQVLRMAGHLATALTFLLLVSVWHVVNVTQIHFFGDLAVAEEIFGMAAIYVCVAWAAWVAIYLAVEVIIDSPKIPDDSYDAHLLRLIARVLSPIAFGAIIALGASDIGIPALGIVAGLGVGGIAVALAAQSTIDNLFGGLSIFADRPFRIGDLIRYGEAAGVVQTIGLRSTRILSEDGNLSVVPNGHLARISITNVTAHDRTGLSFVVRIKGDTKPEDVTRCMDALKGCASADAALTQRKPSVRLVSFEEESIEIDVAIEAATSEAGLIEEIKNRLVISFVSAMRGAGVTPVSVRARR